MTPEIRSLMTLRDDAIARGMPELAIAYGWSLIKLWGERLQGFLA